MLRPFRSILPTVHPTAYIDQSAQVIGDVEIGEASSVWMNVVIRGDVNTIRIGDRTNIQDGTVIHVMRGTTPRASAMTSRSGTRRFCTAAPSTTGC